MGADGALRLFVVVVQFAVSVMNSGCYEDDTDSGEAFTFTGLRMQDQSLSWHASSPHSSRINHDHRCIVTWQCQQHQHCCWCPFPQPDLSKVMIPWSCAVMCWGL